MTLWSRFLKTGTKSAFLNLVLTWLRARIYQNIGRSFNRYKDWHKLWEYTRDLSHSDKDGWVPPQLDFDKVKARHDKLFQLYIQKETAETSEDEAKSLWFYLDKD